MTLLTFNNKYVVASTTAASTSSSSLVDDPYASQTFSLDSSKVVLVIYQANNVYNTIMNTFGMQNAINIDGTDVANSWDSPKSAVLPARNCVFWVGTLAAGSHIIKGRFACNYSGYTVTISNRVLLIIIFNGNEFYYIDNATSVTTSSTSFIDDSYAQLTFTPSGSCKALIMYNISNSYGSTETPYGKKAAVNINGADYGQAEKSSWGDGYPDSVFTAHALSLTATSTTVKGRFAANTSLTVTISRRQLAVLLLADTTLLDISTSTTQVSTTSNTLVDDTQAVLTRTTSDTRELLVIAVGTKRHAISSSYYGECYGINVDGNDRANSRGSPYDSGYANSAATAWAERLSAGSHTVKGRFSNNYGTETAVISARQFIALWLSIPVAYTVSLTESLGLKDSTVKASSIVKRELLGLSDIYSRSWAAYRTYTEPLGLSDVVVKNLSVAKAESLGLSDVYARVWSIYRVYSELLGLKDTIAKSVSAFRAESLGLVDFYSRCWTAYRVFAEPLGLSDTMSAVRLFYQTLTELLELSDVVAKAPSVVRAESLGLLDYYSRLWSIHRTYGETLGLADKVQKASSTLKSELLGLSDVVQKSPSILKSELLGLLDAYSWTWTAYRSFTETLGLSDTVSKLTSVPLTEHLALLDAIAKSPFTTRTEALGLKDYVAKEASSVKSESLGLADTVGKETSRTFAEALGLSDTFTRIWTIQRVLGESLGLKDALQKTPSTLKTEMLGLLDSYSRIWLTFRTYPESLGLSDKVVKTAAVPLAETLGLFDKLKKSSFTTKTERLGLADFTVKGVSVARTERLGLSDVLRKAPGKKFSEALGLKDVYSRVFAIHRTFTEPLGLKDTVYRGVALHALVEVLGLYDSILYGKNVTVLAKLIRKYMQLVNLGGDWNE